MLYASGTREGLDGSPGYRGSILEIHWTCFFPLIHPGIPVPILTSREIDLGGKEGRHFADTKDCSPPDHHALPLRVKVLILLLFGKDIEKFNTMDQLFINERELPPTPTSAQRLASLRDAESTAQGKSPEILPPPPASEEESYQLWLGDRDASDERSRQENTRNTEPMSVQQGKSPEVLAPTPPASEEEAFQAWLENEEHSNRSQPKQLEERLASEQNAPGYSQRERQLALDKRLGAPGQRRPSQASSTQGPSRAQDTLVDVGDQSSSTLDIYDNGSDRGNASRNSSPSVGVPAEEPSVSNRPVVPRRYSRPSRPYSGYPGNPNREGQIPSVNTVRQSGSLPSQIFRGPLPQTEVVVPRWQPDAEVTYCPICRTQFSFFVRKHHCRYVMLVLLWNEGPTFQANFSKEMWACCLQCMFASSHNNSLPIYCTPTRRLDQPRNSTPTRPSACQKFNYISRPWWRRTSSSV